MLRNGRKNDGTYTYVDRVMAMALTEYEASLCPGCGQPKHKSMDPDYGTAYKVVRDVICHGCEVLAEDAEQHKDQPQVPGLKVFVAEDD